MTNLYISKITNQSLSKRNILTRPPEPPIQFVMKNPSDAIYIGKTRLLGAPFYWNYEDLINPHIGVVGMTGAGKSFFIKTFLVRANLVWNSNAIILDWSGEYKDWVREVGGHIISLGKGNYLNLLDTGGMRPYDRVKQVMRALELLTDIALYPEQRRLTEEAIEKAYRRMKFKMDSIEQTDELGRPLTPPTLKDVVAILEEKAKMGTYEFPAELNNAIFRLKKFTRPGDDYFARQSTLNLEKLVSSGLVDIDLSGLPDETFRAMGALTILQFIREKMRREGYDETKKLRVIVVVEEAWKISKEENSDVVLMVREGRKYNFGVILVTQNPTDVHPDIFANLGSVFIFKTKHKQFLDYLQNTIQFSNYIREEIRKFGIGACAVHLSFTTSIPYSSTFIVERVEGEELTKYYFIDLKIVLSKQEIRGGLVATTLSLERAELRKKLRRLGLKEEKIEELIVEFEKRNRQMNVVDFVWFLESAGIPRKHVSLFLKEFGIPDRTLINIFSKVEEKKGGKRRPTRVRVVK